MSSNKVKDLDASMTRADGDQNAVIVPDANSDGFVERMKVMVDRFGSIAEISRKSGIGESTVKKWVDGISDPSRSRCIALARGTGVSLMWLVAGEGTMEPEKTASQSQSHAVRYEVLRVALQLAEDLTEGKVLSTEERAELVGLIYEMHEEGLPEAKILRFARAAVK